MTHPATTSSIAATGDSLLADLMERLTEKLANGDGSAAVEAFLLEHPAEAERLRRIMPTLQVLAMLDSWSGAAHRRLGVSPDIARGLDVSPDIARRLGVSPDIARRLGVSPDIAHDIVGRASRRPAQGPGATGKGSEFNVQGSEFKVGEGKGTLNLEPGTWNSPLPILGDYRILREIGRGGMGIVYEAEQISLHRRVALKVLPLAGMLDERALTRFKNEAQAAASLTHPNIVPIYAIDCESGIHYYAMQFIDGQPLDRVIAALREGEAAREGEAPAEPISSLSLWERAGVRVLNDDPPNRDETSPSPNPKSKIQSLKSGPQRYRCVAELGIQAAEALQYAHDRGIIHRDIKPANLLLGNDGKLWITDFGLAHIEGADNLTMSGDLLGTLRYMSPEQALGSLTSIDHRTDIYSLGATLYELLTGQPVVAGHDRGQLLRQIAEHDPRPPRQLDRRIPVDLETIVLKTLSKEPGDRYLSARELRDDLQRYIEHRPICARRLGLISRMAKWSQRNQGLVAAAATAVVFSAALLGGLLGWWTRDRAAQRAAMDSLKQEAVNANRKLGIVLTDSGKGEEAIAIMQRPIELQPDTANHQYGLGRVLHQYGKLDEAIAAYRKALELDPRHHKAHNNLGCALQTLGQHDEAVREFRTALGIKPDYALPHYGLGTHFMMLGLLDEAMAHFREAIARQSDHVESHIDLATCLLRRGQFAEAHAEYRLADEIILEHPEWPNPREDHTQRATRIINLDTRLDDILSGKVQPADAKETTEFAALCFWKGRYAAAVKLYTRAFTSDRTIVAAGNDASNEYQAACAAVLAADSQVHDDPVLASGERIRLLDQAHEWLALDLVRLQKLIESEDMATRRLAEGALARWQHDPNLASIRNQTSLSSLPVVEQQQWAQLWREAKRVREQSPQ
jgi:serine/threonine protein kinase/Flp pilus assembly protein TadD